MEHDRKMSIAGRMLPNKAITYFSRPPRFQSNNGPIPLHNPLTTVYDAHTMSFVKLSIFGTSFEVRPRRWHPWHRLITLHLLLLHIGHHSLCRSATGGNGYAAGLRYDGQTSLISASWALQAPLASCGASQWWSWSTRYFLTDTIVCTCTARPEISSQAHPSRLRRS